MVLVGLRNKLRLTRYLCCLTDMKAIMHEDFISTKACKSSDRIYRVQWKLSLKRSDITIVLI